MSKPKLEWQTEKNVQIKIPFHVVILKKFLIVLGLSLLQIIILRLIGAIHFDTDKNNNLHLIIPNRDISLGEKISDSDFSILPIKESELKSYFVSNGDFVDYEKNFTTRNILKGSPLLISDFTTDTSNKSITDKIPAGKRLYTLNIPLGPFKNILKRGDYIDVIAHLEIPGLGPATENILEGIKIVNIGENFERSVDHAEGEELTFFLTPEEIKILTFMKPYSTLSLSIRNPNELMSIKNNDPITFNKFIQNNKIQKIINNDSFRIINGKKIK